MLSVVDWLLPGPPYVQYRARLDLLGQREDEPQVVAAREAMLAQPEVQALVAGLADWPGRELTRHNDAGHPLHKLAFLADLGLRQEDPGMGLVVERALAGQSPEGAFELSINVPVHFGGSGTGESAWMLCDAPTVLYALATLGLADDPRVERAAAHLAGLARENGWPCAVASRLGGFRGPGRKGDPCPYATLVATKALAALPRWRESEPVRIGAEALLSLWQGRRERRPYMFAMGSGFAKLKAPLIWYGALHLFDVLSRLPWLRDDPRLAELAGLAAAKADDQGRFTPESVWQAWKRWDFGQKREPSPWVTLLAQRALRRLGWA